MYRVLDNINLEAKRKYSDSFEAMVSIAYPEIGDLSTPKTYISQVSCVESRGAPAQVLLEEADEVIESVTRYRAKLEKMAAIESSLGSYDLFCRSVLARFTRVILTDPDSFLHDKNVNIKQLAASVKDTDVDIYKEFKDNAPMYLADECQLAQDLAKLILEEQ